MLLSGSLFSHGIAIAFGSFLGNIENYTFQHILKLITYLSFIIFGILTLRNKAEDSKNIENKNKILKNSLKYSLFIASAIAVGELGDKTFLASIGLGIEYPNYKTFLILGAITGMVVSDFIAVIFGKALSTKIPENLIQNFSGFLFLIFGFIGLFNLFI